MAGSADAVRTGFEVELLRSAKKDEGSWVSMTFDPHGRVLIAREDRGILRLTLPVKRGDETQLESINDTLRECRGLLWAFDALYANANNDKIAPECGNPVNTDDAIAEIRCIASGFTPISK